MLLKIIKIILLKFYFVKETVTKIYPNYPKQQLQSTFQHKFLAIVQST